MIRYTLNCEQGHSFESWFQNSVAYDKQAKRGLVNCPVCGSAKVEKAIMAPRLARTNVAAEAPPAPALPPRSASPPSLPVPLPATGKTPVAMTSPMGQALRKKLKELREHVTRNSNYVGARFPEEARKIHYGETDPRSIYGEASPEEAKELHDEGIEFHPLPILPDDMN
jgi:hypothetical protein